MKHLINSLAMIAVCTAMCDCGAAIVFSDLHAGGTYTVYYYYESDQIVPDRTTELAFRFASDRTGYLTEFVSGLVRAGGALPTQVYLTIYADSGAGPGPQLAQWLVDLPGRGSNTIDGWGSAWSFPLGGTFRVEAGASYYISVRRITNDWTWYAPNPPPLQQTIIAFRRGGVGAWTVQDPGDIGAFELRVGDCGSADFNHDGDSGTDADIEAFFACISGNCCPTCDSPDFNQDGDTGTDADIEAFFRVLAGGNC